MTIVESGFRKEFEIEVDGITYGATATGKVKSVYDGDDVLFPMYLEERVLEELDLDVYDQDGEQAQDYVYEQVEMYVEDNFEGWI